MLTIHFSVKKLVESCQMSIFWLFEHFYQLLLNYTVFAFYFSFNLAMRRKNLKKIKKIEKDWKVDAMKFLYSAHKSSFRAQILLRSQRQSYPPPTKVTFIFGHNSMFNPQRKKNQKSAVFHLYSNQNQIWHFEFQSNFTSSRVFDNVKNAQLYDVHRWIMY